MALQRFSNVRLETPSSTLWNADCGVATKAERYRHTCRARVQEFSGTSRKISESRESLRILRTNIGYGALECESASIYSEILVQVDGRLL